ncbi:MAG: FG-GAP repeat protein [Bacteroidetes bacterium]|nr:FG-GAP repeat protein [Bacteroidota bacterium]
MKRIKIWMLLLSVIMFQLGHSQSWVQQDKITASDRQVEANFGGKNFLKPVSIYGDIAVVGAAQNNHSGLVNAGAVYIYERTSAGDWVELQKITASDAQANANFGASVAISEYEDFIVVGAPRQHQPLLGGGELVDSGAAYIFKKTFLGWVEHLKILPEYADRETNGYYGQSVDITSRRILVGSLDDGDATLPILNGAGAAYLFERTGGSGSPIDWVLKQKITPANRNAFDLFGTSVSISQNIAVIGAAGNDYDENEANEIEDSGAAYIFEKPTVAPVWLEVKKLTSTDRNANEFFGVNVNIDNYFIIAGAPGDNLDANGSNPLIQSGSAFVYHKNTVTGVWSLQNKLVPSDRNSNDSFGHAVEISSEGLLVVGSIFEDHNATGTMTMNNAGSAYISKYNSLSQT